jgi:hypothetical protein
MSNPERALRVDEAITYLDFTSDAFGQDVLGHTEADRKIQNLSAAKGMIWAFIISVPLWLVAGITVVIYLNS